jgi:hypothetical protein
MSEEALQEQTNDQAVTETVESSAPESSSSQSQSSAPASQQDVWSSFRTLPDFKGQDDRAIASRLYASLEREKAATKALQQYQQLIPYAQEYLTHRPEFEKFLQSQSAPQQTQAPQRQISAQQVEEARKWWNPPELRESYRRYLVKDENGRETISQDAPLDARHALYEYQKYKADFAQKFLTNPEEALGPMVEKIAADRAKAIVDAQLREASEVGYVSTLEQENKDWLYQADGKTPTREGLMVQNYIQEAAQRGIATPQARWEYACDKLERDLLREVMDARGAQQQRQQFAATAAPPAAPAAATTAAPAQNQAERDIEYLRREASRNPSRSGPATDPRIPSGPLTFEQRLRAAMARNGIE